MSLAKLSRLEGEEWVPHHGSGAFRVEPARLVAAPSGAAAPLLLALADRLSPPLFVLWVLHTSRTGAELGRYQSPPIPLSDAKALLAKYADFLENDARADIWLHSAAPEATIVLERHGLVYCYGDGFRPVLESAGLKEGTVSIPSPHAHNYHAEYDSAEIAFASEVEWTIAPLRREDEQIPTGTGARS